jgi:apolipoprotein N-acyltransferase
MTRKTTLLALLSAFMMWLAWPPHNWLAPLLFIGLVPLFIALTEIVTKSSKKNRQKSISYRRLNLPCLEYELHLLGF